MCGAPNCHQTARRLGATTADPITVTSTTIEVGFGAIVGTALSVIGVLVFIGFIRNGSSSPPVQQPPLAVSSVASVVEAPPLPSPPDPYLVQAGDTLQQIADRSGVSVADLMAWNPAITDPNYIEISQAVVTAPPG